MNNALCEKRIALNKIKNQIVETNSPIIHIFTETTRHLDDDVLEHFPEYSTIRDQGVKKRNVKNEFVSHVDDIPNSLQFTLNNRKFLQHDSGLSDKSRSIIFYNEEFIEYIKSVHVWVVDGTFKSAPNEFYQLLTFSGYIFTNIC